MEHKNNTYTGRFNAAGKPSGQEAPVRRTQTARERMPSGFANAGQAPRHTPSKPVEKEQPETKKVKKKRLKQENAKRAVKKKFSWMKLLTGLLIAILIGLILIVIFGDRGAYHQMPIITRQEAEGSFTPEETPLPGIEEAI